MKKLDPAQRRAGAVVLVRVGGLQAVAGAAVFVLVVGVLQHLQPNYDPSLHLISELVFGAHGVWLIAAFIALGAAFGGLGLGMLGLNAGALSLLAYGAGMCFVGAGAIPLGSQPEVHIPLIAIAFVLSGLLMIFGPLRAFGRGNPLGVRRSRPVLLMSWALALAMLICAVLGSKTLLPIGIAQRAAAGCLLLWLALGGFWLRRVAARA
jgi:hypothetical protein